MVLEKWSPRYGKWRKRRIKTLSKMSSFKSFSSSLMIIWNTLNLTYNMLQNTINRTIIWKYWLRTNLPNELCIINNWDDAHKHLKEQKRNLMRALALLVKEGVMVQMSSPILYMWLGAIPSHRWIHSQKKKKTERKKEKHGTTQWSNVAQFQVIWTYFMLMVSTIIHKLEIIINTYTLGIHMT